MATLWQRTQAVDANGNGGGTIAEKTYGRLQQEIITTTLPPGTLLREAEVMERFGVGRTPVREALLRLQHDGFVVVVGRRGTFVSEIKISDLAAIYEVRARLEPWATRLAVERANDDDRKAVHDLIAEVGKIQEGCGPEVLLSVDWQVHQFIYRTSKNSFLAETLNHYQSLSQRILYLAMRRYPKLTPPLAKVVHEQKTMLDALYRGDAETAEQTALHHVQDFEADVRPLL